MADDRNGNTARVSGGAQRVRLVGPEQIYAVAVQANPIASGCALPKAARLWGSFPPSD